MAESCKKDTKFKWDKIKLKDQREIYKEKIKKILKSVQNQFYSIIMYNIVQIKINKYE